MPRLQVSIQNFPAHIAVIFFDRATQKGVGRTLRLRSEERVYELLSRCHADRETVNIVEMSFVRQVPCIVDLNLTDDQYAKLKRA
jgi:hypothetical protein